jgi:hypothetical protein
MNLLDFIGLDLGQGRRNVDLRKELEKANKNKISQRIPQTVSELAKARDITQEGALAQVGGGVGLNPVLPAGINAVVDPKTGRLVGKDAPKALIPSVGAKVVDFLTGGISDLDRSGGGLFGRAVENRKTGLGGRPTDFYLSKTQKQDFADSISPTVSSAIPDAEDQLDFLEQNYGRINKLNRNLRRQAAFDEAANYAITEPIRQRFLRDAVTFKQKQLLEAEKIKQGLPNAIQNRMLAADAGFATQAGAIAGQQDAATRFAGLGMQRGFGQQTNPFQPPLQSFRV